MSTRNSLPLTTKLLWASLFFLGIALLVASANMEDKPKDHESNRQPSATQNH